MSIGDGIAFASFMWVVVHTAYILHQRSQTCTTDEVKAKLDKIIQQLEDYLGPF